MRFMQTRSPLPRMRLWAAHSHGFSFVISEECERGDPEWSGYMASWKNTRADMTPHGKQPANLIDGGPWQSYVEAERACKQTLRQLKAQQ